MKYDQREFQQAMTLVMERIKKKYSFAYYDGEDIAQEAYIIGLQVMQKYDKSKGDIVNFLSVSVGNRIKNLMRNVLAKETDTISINDISEDFNTIGDKNTTVDEFWLMIDENLHPSYRKDYLKIKQGLSVPKLRKKKIIEEIKKIVNDNSI